MRSRKLLPSTLLAALALVAAASWEGCSGGEGGADEAADGPTASPDDPRDADGPQQGGRWRRLPAQTDAQREAMELLGQTGYAGGTSEAPSFEGVTTHVRAKAWQGLNFYTSGHGPGAGLMDMDGRLLHTWQRSVHDVWPDAGLTGLNLAIVQFWRRAHLFENGDVLAIFEGHGIARLDRDSNVLWANDCGAHHDLEVLANGDVLVLTRAAAVIPEFDSEDPVLEDWVTRLGPDGTEKARFSILEALERSPYPELCERARKATGDVLHTNAIEVLDGSLAERVPAFAEGNLLISSRTMSLLAVVDPRAPQRFVWTLQGEFKEQHDPRVLPDGKLLVFDNNGRGEVSTVFEVDPATGERGWEYTGTPARPFWSRTCGTAARLPNGNTLITESDGGRAFEVTREGETVWEFWNPARTGEDREYIATLFDVVRLPPDYADGWLR